MAAHTHTHFGVFVTTASSFPEIGTDHSALITVLIRALITVLISASIYSYVQQLEDLVSC